MTQNENGLCGKPEFSEIDLTLSKCFPDQFTCDSGLCIPLVNRCDINTDCDDKSDEKNCRYIDMDSYYAKELLPKPTEEDPTLVYISMSVLAFPSIDTVNLKFTVDFYFNLR